MAPLRALAGRRLADGRVRDLSFAFFYFVYALGQTAAYRSSYPTIQERTDFARSLGENKALRLFYGVPHDLLTETLAPGVRRLPTPTARQKVGIRSPRRWSFPIVVRARLVSDM